MREIWFPRYTLQCVGRKTVLSAIGGVDQELKHRIIQTIDLECDVPDRGIGQFPVEWRTRLTKAEDFLGILFGRTCGFGRGILGFPVAVNNPIPFLLCLHDTIDYAQEIGSKWLNNSCFGKMAPLTESVLEHEGLVEFGASFRIVFYQSMNEDGHEHFDLRPFDDDQPDSPELPV